MSQIHTSKHIWAKHTHPYTALLTLCINLVTKKKNISADSFNRKRAERQKSLIHVRLNTKTMTSKTICWPVPSPRPCACIYCCQIYANLYGWLSEGVLSALSAYFLSKHLNESMTVSFHCHRGHTDKEYKCNTNKVSLPPLCDVKPKSWRTPDSWEIPVLPKALTLAHPHLKDLPAFHHLCSCLYLCFCEKSSFVAQGLSQSTRLHFGKNS